MVRLRLARRLAQLIAALLLCIPPHLVFKLLRQPSPLPPFFLRLAARACGARITIAGTPLKRDVFYLANHVSWLDILLLGGFGHAAFVSKDDVASWPIVGWLARQNHTIFIARMRGALAGQLETLREAIARHQPVALFPEGTTGDGHVLLPFKPALLAVLLPPPRDIQIQPVLIDYGAAAPEIAWGADEPSGAYALRIFGRKGRLDVCIRFLSPFAPGDHADRKAIAAEARQRIEAALASPTHVPSL